MREYFYTILTTLAGLCGPWLFVVISRGIAAGYFLFLPSRAAVSVRFYRALYPNRTWFYHVLCAWRQFQNFTSVYLDRYLLRDKGAISHTFQGREHLLQALKKGQGGILLMSHMGNWEVGARLLKQSIHDLRLMLYMGRQAKEQIKKMQKADLMDNGIRIVAVDQDSASPLDLIEGISFIQSGGFVSMAGDIVYRSDQRVVKVPFLGHEISLPETPYQLAMVAKVPLFIFIAANPYSRQYHFSVSAPIAVQAADRSRRREAIQHAARTYAAYLENHLRRSPFEWYHFKPFLGEKIMPEDEPAIGGSHMDDPCAGGS